MIAVLVMVGAAATVSALALFQFVTTRWLPAADPAASGLGDSVARLAMLGVVLLPNACVVLYGVAWCRRHSRCPGCGAYLKDLLFQPDGVCARCGHAWGRPDRQAAGPDASGDGPDKPNRD
jgi:hypothetical protein